MLDLKFIRENPDVVRAMLAARRMTAPLEELIEADRKWRELLGEAESLRSHQNTVSKEIAQLKRRQAGCLRADRRDENGVSEN